MTAITEPGILTANTYFWNAAIGASSRSSNEKRRLAEVAEYFRSIGFCILSESAESVKAIRDTVEASFYYSESCKNVYKRFTVTENGKESNILAIRKIARQLQSA